MKTSTILVSVLGSLLLTSSAMAAPTDGKVLTRHPARKPAVRMRLNQVESSEARARNCAITSVKVQKQTVKQRIGEDTTSNVGTCQVGEIIASKPAVNFLRKTPIEIDIHDAVITVALSKKPAPWRF